MREDILSQEDPRQRRSKRRLSQALLELVKDRDYRDISVVDICRRAMVHRTTFYTHFEDKDALFRYVLEEELREAARQREPTVEGERLWVRLREEVRAALHFCAAHREIYLSSRAGAGGWEVWAVEDRIAGRIEDMLLQDPIGTDPLGAELAGRFYAGSLVSVIRWWLEKEVPLTEDELLERMKDLLPAPRGEE